MRTADIAIVGLVATITGAFASVGTKSGRDAYGARVRVVAGELEQYREHTNAHGYNSANDPRL